MLTDDVPQACVGCGRPTLWKTYYAGVWVPLCGRRCCGSSAKRIELLHTWARKQRAKVDAAIMARAAHLTEGKQC